MPLDLTAFYEDFGHEAIVGAILRQYSASLGLDISVRVMSNSGGHPVMTHALQAFFRDVRSGFVNHGNALLVARDANGLGYIEREREINHLAERHSVPVPIVFAVPVPYVERWLLLDANALRSFFGVSANLEPTILTRQGYKAALLQICREAGVNPPAGGVEFAEDIVSACNLSVIRRRDDSLDRFLTNIGTLRTLAL